MITLQQLEYIIAIDRHRHFVSAAKACFVTQPTLSMQIKKLEEDLGVIIFDRSKQPIVPTEIGHQIIAQARQILAEAAKINELIKSYHNDISGELIIGIIPTLAPYLLPLFIGDFTREYPNVKIKIVELLTTEILVALQMDTIDLGILVTPIEEKGVLVQPLFYEEMFVFANNDHPISKNEQVNVLDMESPDLWMLTEGHCFRSQVVNLCNYNPENPHAIEYESGSLETLKRMVATEGGYTLIPELAVDRYIPPNTSIKPFQGNRPLREVSLVYSRNYVKKRLIELIASTIKSAVPEKMLQATRGTIVEWW